MTGSSPSSSVLLNLPSFALIVALLSASRCGRAREATPPRCRIISALFTLIIEGPPRELTTPRPRRLPAYAGVRAMWAIAILFAILLGRIGAVALLGAWVDSKAEGEIEPVRNQEP